MSPKPKDDQNSVDDRELSPADAGLSSSARSKSLPSPEMIAALCTPPGRGAIAVVRVSGSKLASSLARVLPQFSWAASMVRKMQLTPVFDAVSSELLDEALVCFFKAPHSFTGEDTIEINCHGGTYIVQRVLQSLLAAGCRQAFPGEFTQRAFLNGKMDLTAAEGIRELVEAQSDQQWRAARHLVSGKLSRLMQELRSTLIEAMAFLEAQIDFPDEGDTADLQLEAVDQRAAKVETQLHALRDSYGSGQVARSGLKVAILGLPNMGKSTLLNTLLQEERAIVTDIAGTTRDYLEESCLIRGRLVRLIDTAGLRDTADLVEQMGVDRARRLAADADLVLLLLAADAMDDQSSLRYWQQCLEELKAETCLRILTKVDVLCSDDDRRQGFDLCISCKTGEGLSELEERMAAAVNDRLGDLDSEVLISHPRHLQAVEEAISCLQSYRQARQEGAYEEMLAFELQRAGDALQVVIGKVDHEDVLDKVFGEFCLGK